MSDPRAVSLDKVASNASRNLKKEEKKKKVYRATSIQTSVIKRDESIPSAAKEASSSRKFKIGDSLDAERWRRKRCLA